MSATILFELDHNRKRLEYFTQLAAKSAGCPSPVITKWLAIYTDRVLKLEQKVQKQGLKTVMHRQDVAAIAKRA